MSEITLYIYIAAVFTFTCIEIQGQNVTCLSDKSFSIRGMCYRANYYAVSWTDARDNCEKWNGKLPTFTSYDHMAEVFKYLVDNIAVGSGQYWIGTQDESAEVGSLWTVFYEESGTYTIYSKNCANLKFFSLCVETYNNNSINNDTLQTAATTAQNIDLISKQDTCLHNDSVPVDGQCYRLSNEKINWINTTEYCNSWNAAVASISTVNQGFKILTAMSKFKEFIWVNHFFTKDKACVLRLVLNRDCNMYSYGRATKLFTESVPIPVLCIELPFTPTLAPESTTTPEMTNTTTSLKMTSMPESTTKLESTVTEELTTEPKSNTKPQLGQNELLNQNQQKQDGLIEQNRLHYKNRLVFIYYRLIDYDIEKDQSTEID